MLRGRRVEVEVERAERTIWASPESKPIMLPHSSYTGAISSYVDEQSNSGNKISKQLSGGPYEFSPISFGNLRRHSPFLRDSTVILAVTSRILIIFSIYQHAESRASGTYESVDNLNGSIQLTGLLATYLWRLILEPVRHSEATVRIASLHSQGYGKNL
jgi:hypothetical protein